MSEPDYDVIDDDDNSLEDYKTKKKKKSKVPRFFGRRIDVSVSIGLVIFVLALATSLFTVIFLISARSSIPTKSVSFTIPVPPTTPASTCAGADFANDPPEIVFDAQTSLDDPTSHIYRMNEDGSKYCQVTHPNTQAIWPTLSPDGQRIVYVGWENVGDQNVWYDLYITNVDGSQTIKLTNDAHVDYAPDWSPDGQRIIFHSGRVGGNRIFSLKVDGTDIQQLTSGEGHDEYPVWSPDGGLIAFSSNRQQPSQEGNWNNNYELYIMQADGTDIRQLTFNQILDAMPVWSPNGGSLAFVSNENADDNGITDIFTILRDGTNRRRVIQEDYTNMSPEWSPDGNHLAFVARDRDSQTALYVANIITGELYPLAQFFYFIGKIDWRK